METEVATRVSQQASLSQILIDPILGELRTNLRHSIVNKDATSAAVFRKVQQL